MARRMSEYLEKNLEIYTIYCKIGVGEDFIGDNTVLLSPVFYTGAYFLNGKRRYI